MIDESFVEFCQTPRQKEFVKAVIKHGSNRKAAKALGVSATTVDSALQRIKLRATERGYSPDHDLTHKTAEGQLLRGTSTLYDDAGNLKLQWVKTTKEHQLAEDLLKAIELHEFKPAPKAKLNAGQRAKDLLSLYTITDFHLGMYAWSDETGEDWDTEIAQRVMVNAINEMAEKSLDADTAILNIQGDFLHWDGLDAVTPMNRHVLDADTRFGRMIGLSLDLVSWAALRLAEKHKHVKIIICEGNHDMAGSGWLRKCMIRLMQNNPRITVDDTEFPYYAHQHGKTMLGFHHGHKKPNKDLPTLFASEPRYRSMWGDSVQCFIHTGHYHHRESSEAGGAIVERHPTLASRDAYAARGGYVSQSGACVITYNDEGREVSRYWVQPRS